MANTDYAGLSFEQVVRKYKTTVGRVCLVRLQNYADAEDCFQNVFSALYTKSPLFIEATELSTTSPTQVSTQPQKPTSSQQTKPVETTTPTQTASLGPTKPSEPPTVSEWEPTEPDNVFVNASIYKHLVLDDGKIFCKVYDENGVQLGDPNEFSDEHLTELTFYSYYVAYYYPYRYSLISKSGYYTFVFYNSNGEIARKVIQYMESYEQ